MAIPIQVVFDCSDPSVVARFWADALGYQLEGPPEPTAAWQEWLAENRVPEEQWNDASAIVDPGGNGPRIYFRVWEGKDRVIRYVSPEGGEVFPVDKVFPQMDIQDISPRGSEFLVDNLKDLRSLSPAEEPYPSL